MRKTIVAFLLLGSTVAFANSTILKLQAQTFNMDVSKLAVTSSLGRSSMACDNFERFNTITNIQNLDYKSFQPRGIFGKNKKIREVSEEHAALLSEALIIESLCAKFLINQDNDDVRLDLDRSFAKLMEHSQKFLLLVINSK